jgi:hypothetical protein
VLEKGHIPEQVWQDLDIFPKDVDAGGNEVSRDATITQESRQRAKSLTHQYQVDLRQKHYQDIQSERKRLEDGKRAKIENQITTVKAIRDKLTARLRQSNAEDQFEYLSIDDIFETLRAPELVEFIVAHDPSISKKSQLKDLGKGKLLAIKDAMERDLTPEEFNTTTLMAYRCRDKECKFDLTERSSDDTDTERNPQEEEAVGTPPAPMIVELSIVNGIETAVLPSQLLSSATWAGVACELFRVDETVQNPFVRVNDEMKQRADLLVKILRSRLDAFMRKRNVSASRQSHWAIKLAIKNLSTVAAHMVLSNHVKDNLMCISESHSLLSSEIPRYLESSIHPKDIGAYLYFLGVNNTLSDTSVSFRPQKYHVF